jgi:hypothetical protein
MRFFQCYAVLLILMFQIIAGCGGGETAPTPTPPVSDTTPPSVTSFTLPGTSATLVVTIASLLATDNVGVTGYLVTESATAPTAVDSRWSTTVPPSFSFTTAGQKTLFAWAKDSAGNVSVSRSAIISITLADLTPPSVTAFTLPDTSASLVVSISSLIATDNVGVTGYLITESATAPPAADSRWSTTVPAIFSFTSTGVQTAYAWAKDAAGNVSASRSATVSIDKTVTVKLFSQSTNSGDLIGGFLLKVTLPVVSVLQTDSAGIPLSSAVFLSGKFAGANPQDLSFDSTSQLSVSYASSNEYPLGEFITIIFTVPGGYVPSTADLWYSFEAFAPSSGSSLSTVTATASFN